MPFRTINEIIAANKRAGGHFFDADAKRFFGSRVLEGVYGGCFFVTSEKRPNSSEPRGWTCRYATDDGRVHSADGNFQAHSRASSATADVKAYARGDFIPEGVWTLLHWMGLARRTDWELTRRVVDGVDEDGDEIYHYEVLRRRGELAPGEFAATGAELAFPNRSEYERFMVWYRQDPCANLNLIHSVEEIDHAAHAAGQKSEDTYHAFGDRIRAEIDRAARRTGDFDGLGAARGRLCLYVGVLAINPANSRELKTLAGSLSNDLKANGANVVFKGDTPPLPRAPDGFREITEEWVRSLWPEMPAGCFKIIVSEIVPPSATPGDESMLGVAFPTLDTAIVGFNGDYTRFEVTAHHEIGHLLGLDHCESQRCTMYFREQDRRPGLCVSCLQKVADKGGTALDGLSAAPGDVDGFVNETAEAAVVHINRAFERAALTLAGKPLAARISGEWRSHPSDAPPDLFADATRRAEAKWHETYIYSWIARQFVRGATGLGPLNERGEAGVDEGEIEEFPIETRLGLDVWRIGRNINVEVRAFLNSGIFNVPYQPLDAILESVRSRMNWPRLPDGYDPPPPSQWPDAEDEDYPEPIEIIRQEIAREFNLRPTRWRLDEAIITPEEDRRRNSGWAELITREWTHPQRLLAIVLLEYGVPDPYDDNAVDGWDALCARISVRVGYRVGWGSWNSAILYVYEG